MIFNCRFDGIMSSPWSKKTVTQLKDELVRRNLEVTGKKADLVARLDVSDQELHSNGTETSAEATADCSMNEAADQAEEASALPENMEESTEESQEQNGADDCTEGEEGEENAEEKIEEEAHDQEEVLGNEGKVLAGWLVFCTLQHSIWSSVLQLAWKRRKKKWTMMK